MTGRLSYRRPECLASGHRAREPSDETCNDVAGGCRHDSRDRSGRNRAGGAGQRAGRGECGGAVLRYLLGLAAQDRRPARSRAADQYSSGPARVTTGSFSTWTAVRPATGCSTSTRSWPMGRAHRCRCAAAPSCRSSSPQRLSMSTGIQLHRAEPVGGGRRHRVADVPAGRAGRRLRGPDHRRPRRPGPVAVPGVHPGRPRRRLPPGRRRRTSVVRTHCRGEGPATRR